MTTANDLTNAANSLLSFIRERTESLQNLETQFSALNENANVPGASAEFNQLIELRDVESSLWNNNTQYTSFVQLYNSAPESAKTDIVKSLRNTVISEADSLIVLGRNQRTTTIPNTKQAIQNAQRGIAPNDTPLVPPPPATPPPDSRTPTQPTPPNPNLPGRRQKNPLGWFSSYTYSLSLYMVNQQGYDDYLSNGRLFVPANNSAIIAQSGGTPSNRRPENVPFDYYIDNLKILQYTTGKDTGTATNISQFSFTITEPYGFSLVTKLRDISAGLVRTSTGGFNTDGAKLNNPLKNFFIIGIRFYGYDDQGNVMRPNFQYEGQPLDPNYQGRADGQAVFERYIDFVIKEFKFKVDGKATTYNIVGVSSGPMEGSGVKRGALNTNLQIQATTVREALLQLVNKLNEDQQILVDNKTIKYKNNYKILGINDDLDRATNPLPPGLDVLFNSSMVLPENKDKAATGVSTAQNTQQVNENRSVNVTPNNATNLTIINHDTPVLQIIQNIISTSTYLRDALTEVNKAQLEPKEPYDKDANQPDTKKRLRWYNVSPQVSRGKYDPNTADFAYDILYIIRPYETPVVTTPYGNDGANYPGAHKRYDYWYTGQNSEIISYEQVFNLSYFQAALDPSIDKEGFGTLGGQGTTAPGKQSGGDKTKLLSPGKESQNTYMTSLFDPSAYARVKMSILGDPDYLMQTSESTKDLNQQYRQYYGVDGFTINPNGGQVFIEIDFKEAIDYDTNKGFMDINPSIRFWDYPNELASKIKGVSYQLQNVTHLFANGKYTQTLEMFINTFGYPTQTQQVPTINPNPNPGQTT